MMSHASAVGIAGARTKAAKKNLVLSWYALLLMSNDLIQIRVWSICRLRMHLTVLAFGESILNKKKLRCAGLFLADLGFGASADAGDIGTVAPKYDCGKQGGQEGGGAVAQQQRPDGC